MWPEEADVYKLNQYSLSYKKCDIVVGWNAHWKLFHIRIVFSGREIADLGCIIYSNLTDLASRILENPWVHLGRWSWPDVRAFILARIEDAPDILWAAYSRGFMVREIEGIVCPVSQACRNMKIARQML